MMKRGIVREPKLPPGEGRWLARGSSSSWGFHDPDLEYLRPITEPDALSLQRAHKYFGLSKGQSAVTPLFDAYGAWRDTPKSVSDFTRLGPLHLYAGAVGERLMSFLLVWRMALDHLAKDTSSRFGKDSKQWEAFEASRKQAHKSHFGYRVVDAMRNLVQHQEKPPLAYSLLRSPCTCDRCDGQHEDLDLEVRLSKDWLLSNQCPRMLKQDLIAMERNDIDVRVAVDGSMAGIEDILYAMAMVNDEALGHLARLVAIFGETEPHIPLIVEWTADDKPVKASLRPLDGLAWVMTRATR